MRPLAVSRHVAAPPAVVWQVLSDLDERLRVMGNVVAIEQLDGGPGMAPGTSWQETRVLAGRRSTRTLRVVECEPGYSVVVHADVEGTVHGMTFTLTSAGRGSELSLELGPLPAPNSDGGPAGARPDSGPPGPHPDGGSAGPHPDGALPPTSGVVPPTPPAFAGLSAKIVAVQLQDDLDDIAAAAEARTHDAGAAAASQEPR